jgi:Histidine ammonia-lyase
MRGVELTGQPLSLVEIARVAIRGELIQVGPSVHSRIHSSRRVIEEIVANGGVVYGVSTGFGKLSDVHVPPHELRQLQLNLVRSHACGIGNPLSEAEVRAMVLLRANVLALGLSGIRLEVIELLCELNNRRIVPVIPEKGSVGASGDLAPLAHLSQTLIGEGDVFYDGKRMAADRL